MSKVEWQREYPAQARGEGEVCPHRTAFLDALRRGVYIPRRVRADYPELEERYPELFLRYRAEEERSGVDLPRGQKVARARMPVRVVPKLRPAYAVERPAL
jgi:hypothetical protein